MKQIGREQMMTMTRRQKLLQKTIQMTAIMAQHAARSDQQRGGQQQRRSQLNARRR
jgi:hypothetical protein